MLSSFVCRCGLLIVLAGLNVSFAEAVRGSSAAAGRPVLLDQAFNTFVEHQGRWAFTERHVGVGMEGKPTPETVFRVDPSQPYAQHYVPVKLRGNEPSEKERKQWAERGERDAKHRQDESTEVASGTHRNDEVYLRINNQKVTPELEHAVVAAEDETSVTYEIPLRKDGGGDKGLFDKFQLTVRVNKQTRQFEHATFRQRSPMRAQLIAKLSEGLIEIEFGTPDPRSPAVPVKLSSHLAIKVLFGKVHAVRDEAVRTEWKHVTPYDERFGVKIGPMRTIEL